MTPVKHAFSYPVYFYCLDLDELETLDQTVRGFGYNRLNIAAIHDKDYLDGEGSIREKLFRHLEQHGCADGIERVELITMARFFNYIFNPVSFYYCYRGDGSLRCAVAEVNNTFGDRHLYILNEPLDDPADYPVHYRQPKQFHVSPFNNMEGWYDFSFPRLNDNVHLAITLTRDNERIMVARLSGEARPLTSGDLARTLLRYPFAALLNFPRISWEAAKLYYRKKLGVYSRPTPRHPMTIGLPPPSLTDRIGRAGFLRFLNQLQEGGLVLRTPDGNERFFGDWNSPNRKELVVLDYKFFRRLVKDGDIGFGESYMAGEWTSNDLTGLLRLFVENRRLLQSKTVIRSGVARLASRMRHALRRNTLRGSRKNIQEHYDLGNDFYRLFLDQETMFYSCAHFESETDSLKDAQLRKAHDLIRKADLKEDEHVLEIGCGWGGFAIEAVKQTGCRVTGITLSEEQLKLARERVESEGLSDRITFELIDYRHVEGSFDKIVSIEMLEAVGHEYFGTFFATCDRLLKPDGKAVLQVITIPDERYEQYRRRTDWIQKHIFPGGLLPSVPILRKAMEQASTLRITDLEDIGPHYAPTLAEWRKRFTAHHEKLLELGYDDVFQRKWIYYFSYCEAGFATRYIGNHQLVLERPDASER
jgi:cyclopropane-fatty-acyl-phospholipid synthase